MSSSSLLSQAPLIHAVAQVQFSELPSFEEGELEALHRGLMGIRFPERVNSHFEQHILALPANGAPADQPSHQRLSRYVFKAPGQQQLVEVRRDRILLKVTDYAGHHAFFDLWQKVMETVFAALPHLRQALLHRFSLRYIDLVVPKPVERLTQLVSGALLPPPLQELQGDSLFGTSVKVIRTAPNQHLRVAFEELLPMEKRLTKVLPDDLAEHDPRCGISINAQAHWQEIEGPYGLLDIEHVYTAHNTPSLATVDMKNRLEALYQPARAAFDSVITDAARTSWA